MTIWGYRLTFAAPGYLALLVPLAFLFWWGGRHSLAVIPGGRRKLSNFLRALVSVLLVGALAEAEWVHENNRLAVMFLLDESQSVSPGAQQSMVEYVNQLRQQQLAHSAIDLAGVIVFGKDAAIEMPAGSGTEALARVETPINPQRTNLAKAMKLALASFPEAVARRIVLVSDGNENEGEALEQAQRLAEAGVSIDVLPIRSPPRPDVELEKLVLPNETRPGQPFDVRVVLQTHLPEGSAGSIHGRLQITRRKGDQETELLPPDQQAIELSAGKRVLTLRQNLDDPESYRYQARFVPDDGEAESQPLNNQATAHLQVHGEAKVLLLEDPEAPGEYESLVEGLRRSKIEVEVRAAAPEQLFNDLGQLQPYDAIVLGNLARENFSDQQLVLLQRNTQDLGAGLIMLGGERSFGAGGWANTPVEEAMPLDFQIKAAEVLPSGSLMLVIDRSGSMSGEKLELSKSAAAAAVRVLGPEDFAGVVVFDEYAEWIMHLQQVRSHTRFTSRIASISPGGGTNLWPALQGGYQEMAKAKTAIRHVMVLSDGQTSGSGYAELAAKMHQSGITTSCVAVGQGADVQLLKSISQAGGGKFYYVENPRLLPRIFIKEARRIARPLIFESPTGVEPQVVSDHELVRGLGAVLPAVHGFVHTSIKPNPLAEVLVTSPQPGNLKNNTILASWTYGLGRAVAFTTDCGRRWARSWPAWSGYESLFSQMVRWSLRGQGGSDRFAIHTDVANGEAHVVIDALGSEESWRNFLSFSASVVDPELKSHDLSIRQVAPGRYTTQFPADEPGDYFLSAVPAPGQAPLRIGLNVPYSAEFRRHEVNEGLLSSLAALELQGSLPGKVHQLATQTNANVPAVKEAAAAMFRHDLPLAESFQDLWHLLAFAASGCFFGDILVRKVAISLSPLAAVRRLLRRGNKAEATDSESDAMLDRLRTRKAQVARRWEGTAPPVDLPKEVELPRATPAPPSLATPAEEESDYTGRLLKAKRKAQDQQHRDDGSASEN